MSHLGKVIPIDYKKGEILINLDENEKEFQKRFYSDNHLDKFDYIIGINTGASHRWRFKQWRYEGYKELREAIPGF